MSAKSHKSDYIILAVLGAIIVVVMLAVTALGPDREATRAIIRSTHSTNIEGVMACYELFRRVGFSVQRMERPMEEETLAEANALILLDLPVTIDGAELDHLAQWVKAGGVLISTTNNASLLRIFPETDAIESSTSGSACSSCRVSLPRSDEAAPPTRVGPAGSDGPLAADVSAVCFETTRVIHTMRDAGRKKQPEPEPLFSDTVGSRVAAHRIGRGCLILVSDSSFLANGWIGKEDNAVLATNLAAYARSQAAGGTLAFDEYHQGYGRHETGWDTMVGVLFHTSPGWGVLCLTAAGVFFMIYKGRRFGRRLEPVRTRRRSKLEYVYAVGATCRAAGANRLVFGLIFKWFRRRAGERVGLPMSASRHDVAARLAQRSGKAAEHYETILQKCEEALAAPSFSARKASALVDQLAHVESEVFDANTAGK